MPRHPKIIERKVVAQSRLFKVESLDLEFSNGAKRTYERLVSRGPGAVMVVAINDQDEVILVREYAGGFNDYCLSLPKGLLEPGEDLLAAANRELMEETGYGARQLEPLISLSLAPNYMGHLMQVILARDLYPQTLEGDEPEPLEVEFHSIHQIQSLLKLDDFHEGRSIAALYIARERLTQENDWQDHANLD